VPIGRNRAGLVAVILAASASFALAAGVISESLRDLERYLKAASSLAIQITTGLDGAKFDTLQPAQREAAARQLQTLSEGLAEIFQSQPRPQSRFLPDDREGSRQDAVRAGLVLE
jgi:hypothetical protein